MEDDKFLGSEDLYVKVFKGGMILLTISFHMDSRSQRVHKMNLSLKFLQRLFSLLIELTIKTTVN